MIEKFKNWFTWRFNNPYNLEMPYGYAPVQIEGTLKTGEYYYFRARGEHWVLQVAKDEKAWFSNNLTFNYKIRYSNDRFGAGWMSKREAIIFATAGLDRYYSIAD